tara:strand:+ start:7 stop:483 length:477 start_codon:yes stop_codon:yes gene_type:complete
MILDFNNLSPNSKCWIYITKNEISKSELESLEIELNNICENWMSHGRKIKSNYKVKNKHFIILFAEENDVSGCSIDSTNREIMRILNDLNIGLNPNSKIGIFKDEIILFYDKEEIIDLIGKNKFSLSDKMINTTIRNKSEYLSSWKLMLKDSWLKNFI